MSNGNGYVKFPINEPAEGAKKSQIEECPELNYGNGTVITNAGALYGHTYSSSGTYTASMRISK